MSFFSRRHVAGLLACVCLAAFPPAFAQERGIVMASTMSTEQSGLLAHLLPAFTKATGIAVRVVAVGTGQALDIGRRGDADVLFVHDTAAEEKFVAEGFGIKRSNVMYNDFVLVGPSGDPAGVKGNDIVAALKKISSSKAFFISRGDRSGTKLPSFATGRRPASMRRPRQWARPTRNVAAAWHRRSISGSLTDACELTDRGTWISFKNRGKLAILVQGDKRLFNQYGVIVVNPAKQPHVKKDLAQAFASWLLSRAGQDTIASYKINGEQLFFPNANE